LRQNISPTDRPTNQLPADSSIPLTIFH